MEKNRSTKIIAIAALFIAVIGLSIGFAAFSSTLTINSSAEVTPDASQWKVGFVFSTSDQLSTYSSAAVGTYSVANNVSTGDTWAATSDITITNNFVSNGVASATIGNLKAYFTAPGQRVVYRFYIKNEGQLDAFLKNIAFTAANTKCTAVAQGAGLATADQDLMADVCNDIKLSITVGGTTTRTDVSNISTVAAGDTVTKLGGTSPVTITIMYDSEGETQHYVDAPIDVDLGSITLTYNAVAYAS